MLTQGRPRVQLPTQPSLVPGPTRDDLQRKKDRGRSCWIGRSARSGLASRNADRDREVVSAVDTELGVDVRETAVDTADGDAEA